MNFIHLATEFSHQHHKAAVPSIEPLKIQSQDGAYVPPVLHPNLAGTTAPYAAAKQEVAEPFSSVGIALVLGFAFMMLVDQCSRSRSRDIESATYSQKRSFTATLGLVVHAAGKTYNKILMEMK